ncbi:uncharacterized protein LOC125947761 [Dermacentor silvarum]|uniref:uncharacterized protein LOC125947761 n=1 Tax=Dermacentor silvarum TaxID=543639 RepID=UPI002101C853|nr:uncharacterized protein LOC125947761 [Dermacentor silvarum]
MAMLNLILNLALLTLILRLGLTIAQISAPSEENVCAKQATSKKNDAEEGSEKPRDNCTCEVDGQIHKYPDGYPCLVLTDGYNGENDYKHGTCQDGKCIYTEIPFGCEDKANEQNTEVRSYE